MGDISVYCILDPTLPGRYEYGRLTFEHMPRYIGISKNVNKRVSEHIGDSRTGNYNDGNTKQRFLNWLCHFEKKVPVVEILASDLSESEALRLERRYIALLGLNATGSGPLLNRNSGGAGSSKGLVSAKTRQKMSASQELHWANVWSDPKRYEKLIHNRRLAASEVDWVPVTKKVLASKALRTKEQKARTSQLLSESRRRYLSTLTTHQKSEIGRRGFTSMPEEQKAARTEKIRAAGLSNGKKTHKLLFLDSGYKFYPSTYFGSRVPAKYKCPIHGVFYRYPELVIASIAAHGCPCSTCNKEKGYAKRQK